MISHSSSTQKFPQGPISGRVKAKILTWPARGLCVGSYYLTDLSPATVLPAYTDPNLLVVFEYIKILWTSEPLLSLEYLPLPIQRFPW